MKRKFYPTGKTMSVDHWEWTKGKGLSVVYTDGLKCKSSYTLRELLKATFKTGDGSPCKEVSE